MQEKHQNVLFEIECFIHTTGGTGDCSKEGLVYKGTCLTCDEKGPSSDVDRDGKVRMLTGVRKGLKSVYWGESDFNGYTRGRQHLEAMGRQIGEGSFILSPEAELLMNGKMDHMQPVVSRMVVSTTVYSGRRKSRNTG